jgi:hypothetical protein
MVKTLDPKIFAVIEMSLKIGDLILSELRKNPFEWCLLDLDIRLCNYFPPLERVSQKLWDFYDCKIRRIGA